MIVASGSWKEGRRGESILCVSKNEEEREREGDQEEDLKSTVNSRITRFSYQLFFKRPKRGPKQKLFL